MSSHQLIDIDIDAGPSPSPSPAPALPQGHVDALPTLHSLDEPAPTLVNRHARSTSSWSAHALAPPRAPPAVYYSSSPNSPLPTATGHEGGGFMPVHLEEGSAIQNRKHNNNTGKSEHAHEHDRDRSQVGTVGIQSGPLLRSRRKIMWDRFRGKGKRKISWGESFRNVLRSSSMWFHHHHHHHHYFFLSFFFSFYSNFPRVFDGTPRDSGISYHPKSHSDSD